MIEFADMEEDEQFGVFIKFLISLRGFKIVKDEVRKIVLNNGPVTLIFEPDGIYTIELDGIEPMKYQLHGDMDVENFKEITVHDIIRSMYPETIISRIDEDEITDENEDEIKSGDGKYLSGFNTSMYRKMIKCCQTLTDNLYIHLSPEVIQGYRHGLFGDVIGRYDMFRYNIHLNGRDFYDDCKSCMIDITNENAIIDQVADYLFVVQEYNNERKEKGTLNY